AGPGGLDAAADLDAAPRARPAALPGAAEGDEPEDGAPDPRGRRARDLALPARVPAALVLVVTERPPASASPRPPGRGRRAGAILLGRFRTRSPSRPSRS